MTTLAIPKQNELTVKREGEYLLIAENHGNGSESVIKVSGSSIDPLCRAMQELKNEFLKF